MENCDIKSKLIKILKTCNGKMTNRRAQTELEQLGFFIVRDGKHYIISYTCENGKNLKFTLGKTPSDKRAILNFCSCVNNKIRMNVA